MKRARNPRDLKAIYQGTYVAKLQAQSPARISRLLPYLALEVDDTVADFGCGTGILADVLRNRVREYVGVDWSAEFIGVAQKRVQSAIAPSVSFYCEEIVEFCSRHKDRFDKAFTLDFSEHLHDSDFEAIYEAIYSSLKRRAILYVHTPNREYILETLKQLHIVPQTVGHVGVRTADEYRELLTHIGFSDFDVRFLPHYVDGLKQLHFLSVLPVVGKYFRARLLVTARK